MVCKINRIVELRAIKVMKSEERKGKKCSMTSGSSDSVGLKLFGQASSVCILVVSVKRERNASPIPRLKSSFSSCSPPGRDQDKI